MGHKVLIVEDEADLSELLAYNFTREGYEVAQTFDGDEALFAVEDEDPDLVLLDWMLPNVTGIEICRQLRAREKTRNLPIIMLTARGQEADRIKGFERGADDYVTKPCSMSELLARSAALLRRANPQQVESAYVFHDISLDPQTQRVRRGARNVRLGPTEFKLLEVLIKRPGRIFERGDLLDRVWGRDADVEMRTVDVMVGRLRRALNRRGDLDPIRTVRAVGYALDETYGR
jgi:two-component system phosphate regulon response regulator PhoB